MNRNTFLLSVVVAAIFASVTAAVSSAAVADESPVVAPNPPLPRTAASPVAALFARRDARRLRELAKSFQVTIDKASKQAATAKKSLNQAKAAQAAAATAIVAAHVALKKATARKTATDKTLAAAKQTLDNAKRRAAQVAKQAKAAADKAAKNPPKSDAKLEKNVTALQQAVDEAKRKLTVAETALAAAVAKQRFETATAAAQQAARQVAETSARKQQATAEKTATDKQVARATVALKPLAAAKTAAEKAAAATLRKLTATEERAALYESAVPRADPKRVRIMQTIKHTRPLLSCRFSIDGENLFFGARDNQLHRLDLVTGATAELVGHRSWIRRFDFHPNGRRLLTGGYEGRLIWWNADDDKPVPLKEVAAHQGFVRAVAVSPDGRFVATGGNDNFVRVWSADDGKMVAELSGHARHVYNVAFHPNGTQLVSGDLMGVLKQWEVGTWKHVRDFDCSVLTKYDKTFRADCGGIRGMDFSPSGESLVVCGISDVTNAFAGIGTPTAVLFDWKTGKRLNVFKPAGKFQGTCWGVRFHPSGNFIIGAGGGSGGGMWFWTPGQDKSFFDYKLPNVAYDVALHPDGLRLAAACYDQSLRIYNLGPKTESEKQAEAAAKAAAAKAAAAKSAAAKKKGKK